MSIQQEQSRLQGLLNNLTEPPNLAMIGIGISVAGVFLLRKAGIVDIGSQKISTETALTIISTLAGIGGFLGQFISAGNLQKIDDGKVEVGDLVVPLAIMVGSNAVGAIFIPKS